MQYNFAGKMQVSYAQGFLFRRFSDFRRFLDLRRFKEAMKMMMPPQRAIVR
ncbi:MAG: hypothetical protein AB1700_07185 [Bacillota bacterium]